MLHNSNMGVTPQGTSASCQGQLQPGGEYPGVPMAMMPFARLTLTKLWLNPEIYEVSGVR